MPPENGSCVKHCAAGLAPPADWDPAARPPPVKVTSNDMAVLIKTPPEVKIDEKTGVVTVAYPKDYKGCVASRLPPSLACLLLVC